MKKSKLGYKRYSPDVRKPYNVISSGRITMQDVDFPVFGIDDMGNAQMMYPGGEYEFPGSQVFEIPMAQFGGAPQISPSLAAYLQRPEQIAKARAKQGERLTFEGKINKALGDPKEKAAELAHYADTEGEGPVDNIRHTSAGMYTADAIANMLSPMQVGPVAIPAKIAGFAGSNLAGLAHELKAFIPSLQGDYKNIPAAARMTAEDMVNNFVGSALALNPLMGQKEKEDLIIRLSDQNYLPDGYEKIGNEGAEDLYVKKQYGGNLEEFGSGGLKQWFAEKWVDVKTGKECGRSGKDKDGRPYPACRPSRRVNSTTPKTASEMSSSEKAKFKREKTSGQRIDYNHKRAQEGLNIPAPYLKPSFTDYIQKPQPIALASGRIEPSNIDFQIAGGIGAGLAKAAAMKKAIWLPKRPKPSPTRSFMEGFGMGMLNPLQEGGMIQDAPEMTNLEGMFDYWLNNYDNGKSLQTQSKEQAFETFKNAYLKAVIEN